MQRVSAEVSRSIGSAEECAFYLESAGVLLSLLAKHTSVHRHPVLMNLREEWPDDYATWTSASQEVGLENPEDASVDSVLDHLYDRGVGITYLATVEKLGTEHVCTYDGFELLMSMGGPVCRFVVRCAETGKAESAHLEWQCHSTQWTRLDTKIRCDALMCLTLVGYGAAHRWPYAAHSLSDKRFRARYQPKHA